jgi:hypothetical protein
VGDFASHLGFAAQRIGITADQLSGLQGAATLAGASAGAMTSGLQTLGQTMVDAIGGRAPEAIAMFNTLGIRFQDTAGHARSVTAVLPEVADKIRAIKDPYIQARVATALFGGAAEELLPFLRQGAAGIARYNEMATRYGVINDAATASANQMRESQARLMLSVQGLGNSISEQLAPVISPLLTQLADWISANRQWISSSIAGEVQRLAAYLRTIDWAGIGHSLQEWGARIDAVTNALGGWPRVLEIIFALMAGRFALSMISPFVQMGVAIAEVIAKMGVLALSSIPKVAAAMKTIMPGASVARTAGGAALTEAAEVGGAGLATAGVVAGALVAGTMLGGYAISKALGPGPKMHQGRFPWLRHPAASENTSQEKSADSLPTPKPGTPQQKVLASQAMGFFVSKGWTPAQAAGIVGNIQQESGFNPNGKPGDSGLAYGLSQWHPDRQEDFAEFTGHGIRGSSFTEQLAFINHELTAGKERRAGQMLHAAATAAQAGAAISRFYERPRDREGEASIRAGNAEYQLRQYTPSGAPVMLAANDGGPGRNGANGQVQVQVDVTHNGTRASASARASGDATVAPPRVARTGLGGMEV